MHLEPFTIAIPDSVLADLRERLARTRFPDEVTGSGWQYGTNLAYLRELVAYWKDRYDWRSAEALLNRFPQWKAQVGDLRIHFVHARGKGPSPLPLLITHGWPGSVAEFTEIIGPLSDPASHGGDPADAFDVIAPSMPGYGFSDHPTKSGMTPAAISDLWAELMTGLGYARFGAQGGDWGSMVTGLLGARHASRLIGIHMNMQPFRPPREHRTMDGLSPEEIAELGEARAFMAEETGYQKIQGTRPQTLSYGLNDSPAGLAAWIVEKFRTWSDCGGEIERRFTKDRLLTNVMLYWLTETANASCRLYYEAQHAAQFPPDAMRIEVPAGFAVFPKEMVRLPRRWVEPTFDIRRWTRMPRGGHFAAMEEPELLVEDVRAFFRPLR